MTSRKFTVIKPDVSRGHFAHPHQHILDARRQLPDLIYYTQYHAGPSWSRGCCGAPRRRRGALPYPSPTLAPALTKRVSRGGRRKAMPTRRAAAALTVVLVTACLTQVLRSTFFSSALHSTLFPSRLQASWAAPVAAAAAPVARSRPAAAALTRAMCTGARPVWPGRGRVL